MTILRLSSGAAALAVSSFAVFGLAAPALGQQGPPGDRPGQGGRGCPSPPGQNYESPGRSCERPRGTSDSTPRQGEQIEVSTGPEQFDSRWNNRPPSRGEFGMRSTYVKLGNFTADPAGGAVVSLTVPSSTPPGEHNIVFMGQLNGQPREVTVPITVQSATAVQGRSTDQQNSAGQQSSAGQQGAADRQSAAGGTPSSLPFTGSGDLLPLTVAGTSMVVIGAGVVVAARRRRSDVTSGAA